MRRLAWSLLGAALLLPGLALVPHSQHVFWLPESAVWLTLVPWAALMAWWSTRGVSTPAVPKNLKRTFLALACVWILSALLALRRDLALLSLTEWLGYPLVFFAVWRLADSPRSRAAIVVLLLSYGLLSTAYAVMQLLGVDLNWSTQFGGRAGAFLGNPNFLGGHLCLLLPLSLALALDQRAQAGAAGRRLLAWAVTGVLGLGLLLAQTRGAWIGAVAAVALVLGLAAKWKGGLLQRNRKPLVIFALAAALSFGALLILKPAVDARLGNTVKDPGSELAGRFFLMRKAVQLSALRPLWGVGPGNVRIQFPRVQALGLDPQAASSQPYVVSEHAHNDFLQMSAETGILGALGWAALMAQVLWLLLQAQGLPALARGPGQGGLLSLGVLGGLTALLIHGLANFPFLILPTQGAAWALAALALRSLTAPAASFEPASPSRHPWDPALLIAGLLFCAALTLFNGRRLLVDQWWWSGQGELELKHPEAAEPWLAKAVTLAPREDRLWLLLGEAQTERGELGQGLDSLRKAQSLSPYDPAIAARLGSALVRGQHYAEAEAVLRPASVMAPNFGGLWGPLGAALYLQGRHAEAAQAYDRWIHLGGDDNAYINKAAALGSDGQLHEALEVLKEAEQLYPDKAMIYANEAITYYKLGQRAPARANLAHAQALGLDARQGAALKQALR